MSKIVQLELELEEMQQRVSKLEELFTDLAKWTDFHAPSFTEEEIVLDNDQESEEFFKTEKVAENSTALVVESLSLILPAEEGDYLNDCEDIVEEYYKIEAGDEKREPGESGEDCTFSEENRQESLEFTDHTKEKTKNVTNIFDPLQLPQSLPSPPYVSMEKIYPKVPPPTLFKCNRCSFASKTRMNLHQHRKKEHLKANCYFCQKSYGWNKAFQNHLKMHTLEHPYKCSHCKYVAKTKPFLDNHLIQKHQIKPFPCGFCQETFILKTQRRLHRLKIHGKEMQCPHCTRKFKEPGRFITHMRIHTGERPFKCHHCPYATGIKKSLQDHIRNIHSVDEERPFACEQCPGKFRFKKNLNAHVRRQHAEVKNIFLCHHCPYATKNQMSLTSQIKLIHSVFKEEDYFKCYFCSRKFKSRNSHFSTHMRTHTGECPYKCPICPFSSGEPSKISSHVRNIHKSDQSGRNFKCDKCISAFKIQRDLNNHSKLHRKTVFKCAMCGAKGFLSLVMLYKHMKEEHPKGGRNFQCPHCPKMFRQPKSLEWHINAHTGNKPFKCSKCSYACAQLPNLNKHFKLCKGRGKDKEVECDECGQRFTNEGNVKRHKAKWHPKNDVLNCPDCHYIFRDAEKLKAHRKRHGKTP